MKYILSICFALLSYVGIAQNSNLIIFTENDEMFQLSVNGLLQNQQPSTHVKVPGLTPATYRVRVKFADPSLGQVTKNMLLEPGQEYTVVVRRKKNTAVGGYFKEVGKAVDESLGKEKGDSDDPTEGYVMRLLSMAPLGGSNGSDGNGSMGFSGQPQNTTPQQTPVQNSNPGNSGTGGSGSMSININASETGFNMNMNVNDNPGGGNAGVNMNVNSQSSQSSWDNAPSGGTGAVTTAAPASRCAGPMSSSSFASAKKSIDNQGFDESKLKIAKQAIAANCMSVAQVAEIIDMFGFEETKLNFAKYAYDFTTDQQNYFQLNDHFGFSSSVDDLDSYIQGKR
jgi:hypothetical protein